MRPLTFGEIERLKRARAHRTGHFSELVQILALRREFDFRFADLSGVDFGTTDLSSYDFTGADLRGADFRKAKHKGAEFTGALVDNRTLWSGTPPYISRIEDPPRSALSRSAVQQIIEPIWALLNSNDRDVLERLIRFTTPNGLVYEPMKLTGYDEKPAKGAGEGEKLRLMVKSVKDFYDFRVRLEDASEVAGFPIEFKSDRYPDEEVSPHCGWFEIQRIPTVRNATTGGRRTRRKKGKR